MFEQNFPKVGDEVYVPTRLFLSRGREDTWGGVAKITKAIEQSDVNGGDLLLRFEELPGVGLYWKAIMDQQKKLMEQFGDQRARSCPDMHPSANTGAL